MNGLHLIADLYRCQCSQEILLDMALLERYCVEECKDAGLTPLGVYFYQFTHDNGEKAGVTGTVVLAESHLAIHTWPEDGHITLDVYVCNYSRDNSLRARHVFSRLLDLFEPQEKQCQEFLRGKIAEEA